MIIKASYHIPYSRTETVCNNFLEIKVTISRFGFLMHLCAKSQPEAVFNDCIMKLSKRLWWRHWQTEQYWCCPVTLQKLHTRSYINHYAVDVCQLPNDEIWKKNLYVQLIPEFSPPMFLLPVSKVSHLSCCKTMNIGLVDLCPDPDRKFPDRNSYALERPAVPVLWSGVYVWMRLLQQRHVQR